MFGLIAPLFRPSFWFHTLPPPFSAWVAWTVFLIMTLFVGLGILLFILVRTRLFQTREFRRLMRRLSTCFFWTGVLGFLLYWFQSEQIPFLSARFWWLVWFVTLVWWIVWIVLAFRKERQHSLFSKTRETYEKWLPKPKR